MAEPIDCAAVLLAGSLGLGHEMMARGCADLLELSGWRTRRLDSMSLLGRKSGRAGERLFGRLVALPGLNDGLHFARLRTGSRLADRMERAASARLVPSPRAELERRPSGRSSRIGIRPGWPSPPPSFPVASWSTPRPPRICDL